jgi:hypothetical protein
MTPAALTPASVPSQDLQCVCNDHDCALCSPASAASQAFTCGPAQLLPPCAA